MCEAATKMYQSCQLGPSRKGGAFLNLYTFGGLVVLVLVLVKIASGETVCEDDSSVY